MPAVKLLSHLNYALKSAVNLCFILDLKHLYLQEVIKLDICVYSQSLCHT